MKEVSPEQLTLARFKAALQTTFRVRPAAGPIVELVLMEATAGRGDTTAEDGENFSIVFKGPADRLLPQRIYSMEHEVMGRFDLFMVPVGEDPDGFQYQAVFNRKAGPS